MHALIAPLVNVSILVGILFYYLRKPISDFVSSRHVSIRDQVKSVSDDLRSAQNKYEEFSSRIKALDVEVRALREQGKQESEQMKTRLLTDARRVSAAIVSDSRTSAEQVFKDLQGELRKDLGEKVVIRAEKLIRDKLTTDEKSRIRHEFSEQLSRVS